MKIRIVHDIPLSPTIVVIFVYLIDERWCRSEIFQFHRQNVVSHSQDHRLPDQSPWVKIVTFLWLITSRSPIRQDAKPENTSVVAIRHKTNARIESYFREMPEIVVDRGESLLPSSKSSSEGGGGGGGENARRRRESWFDVGSKDFHQSEREEPKPRLGRGREAENVASFLRRPEVIQCACRSARNVMETTKTRLWLSHTNWGRKWRAKRGCYPRRNR